MQTGSVTSQTVGARNLEAFRESQERDKQAEKEEENKYIVELLEDIEQNRLNGRIVLVPTRAVEFIALDFIVTNAGVSFE